MAFRDPPHNRNLFVEVDGRYFVDQDWFRWFMSVAEFARLGITTTVTLAKITGPGTNGSLTIVNGLITSVTQPT
jgi:hypothetical protein